MVGHWHSQVSITWLLQVLYRTQNHRAWIYYKEYSKVLRLLYQLLPNKYIWLSAQIIDCIHIHNIKAFLMCQNVKTIFVKLWVFGTVLALFISFHLVEPTLSTKSHNFSSSLSHSQIVNSGKQLSQDMLACNSPCLTLAITGNLSVTEYCFHYDIYYGNMAAFVGNIF